jgi:EAL domain-containing protein (putative c-di-GMP-specific phosphodiesterase class I)/GAF domain-containing protein
MLMASTRGHTLSAIDAVARSVGADVVEGGGLLRISTTDRSGLLRAIEAQLTSAEQAEARAVDVDDPEDRVASLMGALPSPTLEVQCARLREDALGRALRDDGAAFHSVYQPIVDLATGQVLGFEGLLRATIGGRAVMPEPMFAAAEAAGWLPALDRIGRERAMLGAAGWLGEADLFVNVIPWVSCRPEVCLATTEQAAVDAGIRMDQLVVEVAENRWIGAMDHVLEVLAHYRQMGCRVALDDVGAGYASLNRIARVVPEVVKLDVALIHHLPDRGSVAVVRSLVAMSQELGASVVAEGVETAAQVQIVTDLGVDWAQGRFYAPPSVDPLDWPIQIPAGPRVAPRGSVPEAPGAMTPGDPMTREAQLLATLVEVADTLVEDFDLNDLFQVVVTRTVDLLDVSAVGLMLIPPDGRLQLVASTSTSMRMIELYELQAEEGPCVDCVRSGRPVIEDDLGRDETKWPRFAAEARRRGYHAVHAIPMRLRGDVIGALSLYDQQPGRLTPADVVAAQAIADLATIAVMQHRAATEFEQLTANLAYALQSRVVIEQAKGIIAATLNLPVDRSFELLRGHARRSNLRLADVATSLVDGSLQMSRLVGEPWST